jgi:hypothetical protein
LNNKQNIGSAKSNSYWGIVSLVVGSLGVVIIAVTIVLKGPNYYHFHPLLSTLFVVIAIIGLGLGIKGLTHRSKTYSILGIIINIYDLVWWMFIYFTWYIVVYH